MSSIQSNIIIGDSQVANNELYHANRKFGDSIGMITRANRGIAGLDIKRICEQQVYNYPVESSQNFTYLFGTNDNKYMGYSGFRGTYEYQVARCLKAMAAYAMIPDSEKLKGQSSEITYSGSWSNSSKNGGSISKETSVNGATATFTVKGNAILIGTSRTANATTNKFSVTIDNVSYDDIVLYGGVWIQTDSLILYSHQLSVFDNLDSGYHTIVLTATVGADVCVLDWVAGIDQPLDGVYSRFYLTDCLPIAKTGKTYIQSTFGITDADKTAIDTQADIVIEELQSLGFWIQKAPLSTYNPDTSDTSDGVHASQTGHDKLAYDLGAL